MSTSEAPEESKLSAVGVMLLRGSLSSMPVNMAVAGLMAWGEVQRFASDAHVSPELSQIASDCGVEVGRLQAVAQDETEQCSSINSYKKEAIGITKLVDVGGKKQKGCCKLREKLIEEAQQM